MTVVLSSEKQRDKGNVTKSLLHIEVIEVVSSLAGREREMLARGFALDFKGIHLVGRLQFSPGVLSM